MRDVYLIIVLGRSIFWCLFDTQWNMISVCVCTWSFCGPNSNNFSRNPFINNLLFKISFSRFLSLLRTRFHFWKIEVFQWVLSRKFRWEIGVKNRNVPVCVICLFLEPAFIFEKRSVPVGNILEVSLENRYQKPKWKIEVFQWVLSRKFWWKIGVKNRNVRVCISCLFLEPAFILEYFLMFIWNVVIHD